jgi:cytochrome c peroxidase
MLQFCDKPTRKPLTLAAAVAILFVLGTAQAADAGGPADRAQVERHAAAAAALGRQMFSDPSLSASGKMSCASCHSPRDAFGPPNALPVQLGGADLRRSGTRAVPSLEYLQAAPAFTEHFFDNDDEGDESVDNGPTGGLTWDGRVDRDRDQARSPLLSPFEMGNADAAAVVAKVRQASYAGALREIYGTGVFDDTDKAFAGIVEALEVFQQDYRAFYPYSSKYDAYLAGRATLTEQEARGLYSKAVERVRAEAFVPPHGNRQAPSRAAVRRQSSDETVS